jgi:hypothetical protein
MYVTYDKEIDYNYLTNENNAKIVNFSSQTKGCSALNILSNDRKAIWLTENTLPQFVVLEIGNLIRKPKNKNYFKYFGIYCWHAYSTNPKIIELQFSKDNKNFISFGKYEIALKPGTQFFEIKNSKLFENTSKYRYMKVIIKETYGGNRTYLNQLYLFDELCGMNNTTTMNSYKVTQISDNKKRNTKSESESLFISEDPYKDDNENENINYEEEETESKPPVEMERSDYIKANNLIDNNINTSNKKNSRAKSVEKEIINKDVDENSGEEEYDPKVYLNNKKLKKIENILKNKVKEKIINKKLLENNENENKDDIDNFNEDNENYTYEENNSYYQPKSDSEDKKRISNFTSKNNTRKNTGKSPKFERESKSANRIKIPTQTKKNMNKSYAFENNEYEKLENQLRDMEDHLKNMQADMKIETYKSSGLSHSKSFSFLNPSNYMGESNRNPFLDYNSKSINPIIAKNQSPLNIQSSPHSNPMNSNFFNKYINDEVNYNHNHNENINTDNNDLSNMNRNIIEIRLTNIEQQLSNFENEISDLKKNFGSLVDNINRLVEGEYVTNFNSKPNKNVANNDFMHTILNECQKMINERLMNNNNNNTKRSSARKKNIPTPNYIHQEDYEDYDEHEEAIFEKSI